jgi:thioredoxin-like negative regulator of GroEL
MRPTRLRALFFSAALSAALCTALTGCSERRNTASAAASAPATSGIAWRYASTDEEVNAAFTQATREYKPLLLYWGANWCPPCNQLKATLFNRQDVIERSRAFVPVYIDGDRPGAQKLGARFRVSAYPTLVLFNPQGVELTRLPGEVDASQYVQLLTLGMNAQRPVKAVLADALAGGAAAARLGPNDWKLLAFYAWEVDQQQVLPAVQWPATLKELAEHVPPALEDTSARLLLRAAAAAGAQATVPPPNAFWRNQVQDLLADKAATRAQMDVLTNSADDIVRALTLPAKPERRELIADFDAAMNELAADPALSRADRLTAMVARVRLALLDAPKGFTPPWKLQDEARKMAARFDREISDGYERQAVIPTAAWLLEQAQLPDDANALLQANLAKSHSPYYLMSALSANAKRRGDKNEALRWSQRAFETSQGTATRLQWGASLVTTLIELTPHDEARIEKTVASLFDEASNQSGVFYERGARSLQRVGTGLQAWAKTPTRAAVVKRLQVHLDGLCNSLPADDTQQKAACQVLLTTKPVKA